MADGKTELKGGLLGLTLEFYERSGPEIRESREQFVRQRLLPALDGIADVRFERAFCTRDDIERQVAEFETGGVKFDYVTSHIDDQGAAAELGDHLLAAAGGSRLRNMRLGLLGYSLSGIGDFDLRCWPICSAPIMSRYS